MISYRKSSSYMYKLSLFEEVVRDEKLFLELIEFVRLLYGCVGEFYYVNNVQLMRISKKEEIFSRVGLGDEDE